jgi:hypothetical protein
MKIIVISTQDFLEANQAVSFHINLTFILDDSTAQSLTLENGQTREKLAIKGQARYVTISRYPMGTNEEEWKEMINPNLGNRTIHFYAYY